MLRIPLDTEQLARRVAAHSGTTPEDVVRAAVEERAMAVGVLPTSDASEGARQLDLGPISVPDSATKMALIAGMETIAARSAARRLFDRRSIDAIIGYDEQGLPG